MAKRLSEEIQDSEQQRLKIKKTEDDSTSNDSSKVFFSNHNIKVILLNFFKDLDLDLNIVNYDNNKGENEQSLKQHKKLVKNLKIDLNKFKSSDLKEKIHIIGIKDSENQIISAAIVRCFLINEHTKIAVIPLIDYVYSVRIYGELNFDDVTMEHIVILPAKRSFGLLLKKESLSFSQFIEVLKLKIKSVLDKVSNTEEEINTLLEEKENYEDFINTYKEIVAQYPNLSQDDPYDTEEEELINVEPEPNTIQERNSELKVRKKSTNKKVRWSYSVLENEMGPCWVINKEAMEIFYKAVETWDENLFKEAKNKTVNIAGLINYFDNDLIYKFLHHFYRNRLLKSCLTHENFAFEKEIVERDYNNFIKKLIGGYTFLINNDPQFFDRMQKHQDKLMKLSTKKMSDLIKELKNNIKNL